MLSSIHESPDGSSVLIVAIDRLPERPRRTRPLLQFSQRLAWMLRKSPSNNRGIRFLPSDYLIPFFLLKLPLLPRFEDRDRDRRRRRRRWTDWLPQHRLLSVHLSFLDS